MNEELILEIECEQPENWETNIIFIRNDENEVVEINVPDDEEE